MRDICKLIEDHKINVISNFIVGLPNDSYQSMLTTMQLALELNTAMMNVYPCMNLPDLNFLRKQNLQKLLKEFL